MRGFVLCTIIVAASLLASGCAKTIDTTSNEQAELYYNSWINLRRESHPEFLWWPVCYGTPATEGSVEKDYAYIWEDEPGDGDEVTDSCYFFLNYTYYDLEGNVQTTTDRELSHRTGVNYDPTYYYGPIALQNTEFNATVGLRDAINGFRDGERVYDRMRVGGRRLVIVPGWHSGSVRYSNSINYYLNNVTGDNFIYDVSITEITDDIYKYQIDSIEAYCRRHYRIRDSTYTGFYYKCLDAPKTTMTLPDDTTIYINYIGRLLNGQVFDTTITDTAKVWNIYNTSYTYGPVEVNWSSDSTEVTIGEDEDSVIAGFASILTRMNNNETAVGVFYSELGYGAEGSGFAIPGYAPLEFEIRIVSED